MVMSNRQRRIQRKAQPAPVIRDGLTEVVRPQMMETRHLIEPENLRWFVLRVESTKEETLISVLDRKGIPAAIPTIQKERVRRGKLFKWRAPVASGYVLIGWPGVASIPWHELTQFRIVYSPLRDDAGNPVRVPWECSYQDEGTTKPGGVKTLLGDMEAIRRGAAKFARSHSMFAVDDDVRVEAGPFAGHAAKVHQITGRDAIVLLNILGRQTPAKMPLSQIVRAA